MDTNYIIETKNLTKQYGSQKSVADLNIHVKRGRIYPLGGCCAHASIRLADLVYLYGE